jgi:hypothetical protein
MERIALSTLKADDESDSVAENGGMTRTASCQWIRLGVNSGNILRSRSRTRRRTAQSLSYDFRSGDLDEDEDSEEE